MANIDSQISKIRSAERGEDVRDSIISALRDINNDVPADMSNPEEITLNMQAGSDIDHPINPPKLVSRIHVYQPNSGGKSTILVDAKIVDNGKYPSEDKDDGGGSYDPDKEVRYYKSVDVNVPQLANKVLDLEEEITQNGTYSAFDWGADGLRSFTVNVNPAPVSGQFEVTFYDTDRTTVLYTELVPAYGNANYRGPYIPQDPGGKAFAGWNPSPVNVTKNMKCYPNFTQRQMMPGEISEDWDIICAKGGAGYPLGSYKDLYFSATLTVEELTAAGATGYTSDQIITFEVEAIKVAEGEDGSKSTWITQPSTFGFDKTKWDISDGDDRQLDWEHCNFRKWLQLLFTKFAPIFIQHIKPVYKYTQNSIATTPPYSILTTQDYLWSPSVKEMCIDTDYWHDDLSRLQYNGQMSYEAQKAKYYDGVPLALPYFNDLGLTPAQRDEWFYMGPGQSYASYCIGYLRDRVAVFNDRHSAFPANGTATYVDPTTGDTVTARYIADSNNQSYGFHDPDVHFLGFCLV